MTGLERIRNAFHLEPVDRTPWVPFVGSHGGNLIGVSAEEYLRSADNLIKGIRKAIEIYQPDGIPVIFDLQVEAEILDCELAWTLENPPAVISHPLLSGTKLEDLTVPSMDSGRVPQIMKASRVIREAYPGLALYGLITGPFTLGLHLLGTDIFLKMYEDPDYINQVLSFCNDVCKTMADYYMDAGCDVIAVVDPMTSQIGPDTFEPFLTEPISELFDHIRLRNKLSSFFVCGNAKQNIEVMCDCKPNNISIDENIPLDYVKKIALNKQISFGGNLKLTSVLLMGNEIECQQHALETMDAGGNTGFVLAPGCDLPMGIPKENLIAVTKLVYDKKVQDLVRNLEVKDKVFEQVDLSDHWKQDKVVIDIITLDSASCTPCQYMVEAVKEACKDFRNNVEWHEYKIKDEMGIRMMMTLGVKNLPTICMNGEVEFISQIPPRHEIIKTINKHLDQ